jgi:hypothetical protein
VRRRHDWVSAAFRRSEGALVFLGIVAVMAAIAYGIFATIGIR